MTMTEKFLVLNNMKIKIILTAKIKNPLFLPIDDILYNFFFSEFEL